MRKPLEVVLEFVQVEDGWDVFEYSWQTRIGKIEENDTVQIRAVAASNLHDSPCGDITVNGFFLYLGGDIPTKGSAEFFSAESEKNDRWKTLPLEELPLIEEITSAEGYYRIVLNTMSEEIMTRVQHSDGTHVDALLGNGTHFVQYFDPVKASGYTDWKIVDDTPFAEALRSVVDWGLDPECWNPDFKFPVLPDSNGYMVVEEMWKGGFLSPSTRDRIRSDNGQYDWLRVGILDFMTQMGYTPETPIQKIVF